MLLFIIRVFYSLAAKHVYFGDKIFNGISFNYPIFLFTSLS